MSFLPSNVDTKTVLTAVGAVGALATLGGFLYWNSHSGPSPRGDIPAKSKALVLKKEVKDLKDLKGSLDLEEVDTPTPGPGEVLVKVERSPINPSDVMFVQGQYMAKATFPTGAGFEGAGLVVQTGGGVSGWKLLNKRVGFVAFAKSGGCWKQYVVVPATQAIALNDDTTYDEGCSIFVNPGTAVGIIDTVQSRGVKAFIHTAAASQLGKMLIRKAKQAGLDIICVVRREEQAAICKAEGAQYILNSTDAKFEENLKAIAAEKKATLAFDAVAGTSSEQLLANMPPNSEVFVYGGLSGKPASAGVGSLITGQKLSGFWLSNYFGQLSTFGKIKLFRACRDGVHNELKSEVVATYPLERVSEALQAYVSNMTAGKIAIAPFELEVKDLKKK